MSMDPMSQCLAAQTTTLLLMPQRRPLMSVPLATCPGDLQLLKPNLDSEKMIFVSINVYSFLFTLFLYRETETFESVTEDDQLPQVVDDLHDVHVSPGSPFAKMQLKVKGTFVRRC